MEPQRGQGAGAGRQRRRGQSPPAPPWAQARARGRAHSPLAGRRRLGRRRARAAGRRAAGRRLAGGPHHHRGAPHRRARGALGRARRALRACAGVHGAGQLRRGHRLDVDLGRPRAARGAAARAQGDDRLAGLPGPAARARGCLQALRQPHAAGHSGHPGRRGPAGRRGGHRHQRRVQPLRALQSRPGAAAARQAHLSRPVGSAVVRDVDGAQGSAVDGGRGRARWADAGDDSGAGCLAGSRHRAWEGGLDVAAAVRVPKISAL